MSNNIERQKDEIEALKCLIPEDKFIPLHTNNPPFRFQIKYCDESFDENARDPAYSPLLITFTLPQDYPADNHRPQGRPHIKIDYHQLPTSVPGINALSRWLHPLTERLYIRQLVKMCKQNRGFEIVFDFHQFVEEDLLSNARYPLDVKEYQNQRDMLNTMDIFADRDEEFLSDDDLEQFDPTNSNEQQPIIKLSPSAQNNSVTNNTNNVEADIPREQADARLLQAKPYKNPQITLSREETMNILHTKYKLMEIEGITASKNIFHAFIAPITYGSDVCEIMSLLNTLKLFKTSVHNHLVYRYIVEKKNHLGEVQKYPIIGSDEDGEAGAGVKMESIIRLFDASAMVVVTRQFSGILLGPTRFKILATLTQQALEQYGFSRIVDNNSSSNGKKK